MSWLTPVIAGAFTLAGVWLGSVLNQKNSYDQAHRQKMRDLRIRSYAKLMGLKLPLIQALRTMGEAKILCEYYDARFHITGNACDLEEAKQQNMRSLALIPEISELRRDVAETLGEIRVAFPASGALGGAVQAVYVASAIKVEEIRGTVTTLHALEKWKREADRSLVEIINSEYDKKIEILVDMLYALTDKA